MTITTFTRHSAREFGQQFEAHLKEFAQQHGVRIRYAGGKFDPMKFEMKVNVSVIDGRSAEDVLKEKFARDAALFGFQPEVYGTIFHYGSSAWRLVGFETNRPKYCVLAKRVSDGATKLLPRIALGTIRTAIAPSQLSRVG